MPVEPSALFPWLAILLSVGAAAAAAVVPEDLGLLRITPSPVLAARDAFQTAGFIGGDPNSPLTCPGTSTVTKGNFFVGCCGSTTCWKPSECHTVGQEECGPNCVYSQITSCTDVASPYCAKYLLLTDISDINPYVSFVCLPTPTTAVAFVSANSAAVTATGTTDSNGSSVEISGSSTASSAGPSSGSGDDGGGGGGGGGGYTEDQKIALGTGIGVGVPAILVAILIWWLSRRK